MTNSDLFPYVNKCLLVLLALSVSTASAEILFSIMRRLKTYLQWGLIDCPDVDYWIFIVKVRLVLNKWLMFFCPKERQTSAVLLPSVNECAGRIGTVSILVFGTIHCVFSHFFMMTDIWKMIGHGIVWIKTENVWCNLNVVWQTNVVFKCYSLCTCICVILNILLLLIFLY